MRAGAARRAEERPDAGDQPAGMCRTHGERAYRPRPLLPGRGSLSRRGQGRPGRPRDLRRGRGLIFAARCSHHIADAPFSLFCDHFLAPSDRTSARSLSFQSGGDASNHAELSILCIDRAAPPKISVTIAPGVERRGTHHGWTVSPACPPMALSASTDWAGFRNLASPLRVTRSRSLKGALPCQIVRPMAAAVRSFRD
jgi:hypothetical protein